MSTMVTALPGVAALLRVLLVVMMVTVVVHMITLCAMSVQEPAQW